MFCQLQLVCRSLKTKFADGVAERLIRLSKTTFCKIICIIQISPHANDLGTLPGEYKCKLTHKRSPYS